MGNFRIFSKLRSLGHFVSRYLLDSVAAAGAKRSDPDVVVVVRIDGIGDFVVWLDSARVLRERYSDRRIILVADGTLADLASQVGYFDNVIGIDRKASRNADTLALTAG